MRCQCGSLIRASAKRCRPCALEFVRGIDTDFIQVVKQEDEEEMTDDTTKRMSSPQRIAADEWAAFQKDLRWKAFIRKACVVGIVFVVGLCLFVAWKVIR